MARRQRMPRVTVLPPAGSIKGTNRPKRSFFGRWLRRLGWLLLILLSLSILLVLPLRWLDPPGSMVMLQRRLEAPAEPAFQLNWQWCDYAQLGSLPRAVVAAEDQRFVQHHGFDLIELQKALEAAGEGGRLRGASTISQQVAKNLYLTTHRSVLRKAAEAWFTVLIETLWSKQRILEMHLNIAEWGPGTFGACAAASQYFHRTPAELDERQAALLAATLPAPLERSPAAPGAYTQQRAGWILEQMPRVDLP